MLNDIQFYAVFLFIPHIINFLLYVVWRLRKITDSKFGYLREDGTIAVPNPLTLKWVIPYYWNVTEKQATYCMYSLTGLFGIVGLFFL